MADMADEEFTPEELELLDEMIANLKSINRLLSNSFSACEKNSRVEPVLIDLPPIQPIPSEIESTMVVDLKEDQIEDAVDDSLDLVNTKGAVQVTNSFNNDGLGANISHQVLKPFVKCTSSNFVPVGFIPNSLLDLYTKCGSLVDAQKVFDEMGNRDLCPQWVIRTGLDSIEPLLAQINEHKLMMLTPVSPRLPPKPPDVSYCTVGFAESSPKSEQGARASTATNKIGQYDVQCPIAVVKNVFIPLDAEGTLLIELEDVMPFLQFLAPVETGKDHIASALETLRPTTSWERTTAAGQGVDGVLLGWRGLGVTMEALCNYLGSEYGNTFALARVFAFLSGPPDYGAGQLDTRRYGEQYARKGEDADRALLPEQTPFYKDLDAVVVQTEASFCVDIFAVTNEYTELASLKFLSIESEGSLFLYTSTEDSTLPQDMYRMLSRPYAFVCEPGNSYGHLFPDPQYENVQHSICYDSYATYVYDFVFENCVGFSRTQSDVPTIQITFQYAVVATPQELLDSEGVSTSRTTHSLKRRLRIRTLQFGVAKNIHELFDSCDPKVMLSLLVHMVILVSLEEGVREGRILLQEWLVILTAQYNDAYKLIQYSNGSSIRSQLDVAFSQCPQLPPLPRLNFALLRNPLLCFHEEGVHTDYRIYLQCLFSVLQPSSLHRAVDPVLTSYPTTDKQAYPRHSLGRAALITSNSPIFFLDAFTTLIMFYSSTADPALPFPPSHDCLLRTTINKLKHKRCITPKLIFIRGGLDDASLFENFLIKERDVLILSGQVGWLLSLYAAMRQKFDDMDRADKVFFCMLEQKFGDMQQEGVKPNEFTSAGCLSGCSQRTATESGMQLHSTAIKSGLLPDMYVSSALVDMYAKCGSIEDALESQVFVGIMVVNGIHHSQNSVAAKSFNGHNLEDKVIFKGDGIVMNENSTHVKPNEITERMTYGAAKSNQGQVANDFKIVDLRKSIT